MRMGSSIWEGMFVPAIATVVGQLGMEACDANFLQLKSLAQRRKADQPQKFCRGAFSFQPRDQFAAADSHFERQRAQRRRTEPQPGPSLGGADGLKRPADALDKPDAL